MKFEKIHIPNAMSLFLILVVQLNNPPAIPMYAPMVANVQYCRISFADKLQKNSNKREVHPDRAAMMYKNECMIIIAVAGNAR
jgi:hypothetical protein